MNNPFQLIGKSAAEVQQKIQSAFHSLFEGNDSSEKICFDFQQYKCIIDIGHSDIRSEGMSYGMYIAAKLGLLELFQALWEFSKTYLQNAETDDAPYFAWQVGFDKKRQGQFFKMDAGAAPDGEEYFAAALLLAARRFGNNAYRDEALKLLHAMAHKKPAGKVRAMFDPENFLVRFSPVEGNDFTDPSYHTLAFYRLFAAETKDTFWESVYKQSVAFLKCAAHPDTGLFPDYAEFDGSPKSTAFSPHSDCFSGDAWRVAYNLALAANWEIPGICEKEHLLAKNFAQETIRKMLRFFKSQKNPRADYRLNGIPCENSRPITSGLIAMNAAAAAALDFSLPQDRELARDFLNALWNVPVPTGTWCYYDGMLYLLGFLALSGR